MHLGLNNKVHETQVSAVQEISHRAEVASVYVPIVARIGIAYL